MPLSQKMSNHDDLLVTIKLFFCNEIIECPKQQKFNQRTQIDVYCWYIILCIFPQGSIQIER